jgi:hypothetical protein
MAVEPLFRLRLVIPSDLAGTWADRPEAFRSPGGGLTFVPLVVGEAELTGLLAEMTRLSATWLRAHPEAPDILDVCPYEREPEDENDWLALPVSLGAHGAEYQAVTGHRPLTDCEDLEIGVSARAQVYGDTGAHPEPVRVGRRMWHIRTRRGDGRIQDSTRMQLQRQGQVATWNL